MNGLEALAWALAFVVVAPVVVFVLFSLFVLGVGVWLARQDER